MLFEPLENTRRIVICGEVSSGKSTVLNALMRRRLLPDNIGAPTRPAISVRWQRHPVVATTFPDGTSCKVEPGDMNALRGAERIVIGSSAAHLRPYELIELPMTTADELGDEHFETVKSADLLLWVTIASQAWRLTERCILDELSRVRPKYGILALSRADKLRHESDRDKLKERLRAETGDYFDAMHFVQGTRPLLEKSCHSRKAWKKTGAAGILENAKEILARGEDDAASRVNERGSDSATIGQSENHEISTGEAQTHLNEYIFSSKRGHASSGP
ncbi:MAG: hypothetical protein CSA74_03510 [Rhodobacterales bacterium]|nr:MAG: hypothetical protein CSA74_03510 [Rhodobacterales bacterium]